MYPHQVEPLSRAYLIGERPVPHDAQLFLPDATFEPVAIDRLPETIWANWRRVVDMQILPTADSSTLLTLFIPFGVHEPLYLYETIHLVGEEGWVLEKSQTATEAKETHHRYLTLLCEHYNLPLPVSAAP